MTNTTSDTTIPVAPAQQEEAHLTPDVVLTSPAPALTGPETLAEPQQDEAAAEIADVDSSSALERPQPDEDDDDKKEPAPEPYDIEKCNLTFRVEIFPREAGGVPRLALLAVNSHGDEPFQPRLVAFDGDFTSLMPHLNHLYGALAAAMPERAAAAAKRQAEEQVKKEAEEAQRQARSAKTQIKSSGARNKRKRGQRVQLSDVPGDEQGSPAPSSTQVKPQPAPDSALETNRNPVPAEPEKEQESEQFSLFS